MWFIPANNISSNNTVADQVIMTCSATVLFITHHLNQYRVQHSTACYTLLRLSRGIGTDRQ